MSAAGPPVMSLPQARRVGVAAQQLTGRRPARVTRANLARMTEHVGVLQIDSVSVLARAHLLPVLARLGPYDLAVLDRATARAPRLLVEEIAHEAAYVPPEVYALLAHRRAARREGSWALSFGAERADLLTRIQAVIGERGALTSREVERVLESPGGRAGWWEWSEVKTALELLFRVGDLAVAGRTAGFERRYDLPERVLPAAALTPAPAYPDAVRALVARAARALGVATAQCLRDYYRLPMAPTRQAVAELVEEGELLPVTVRDWGPAWLHRDARVPRAVAGRALLAPFDPLVFERTRTERLFGMHYRIGIYTPAADRTHGYYVMPFLLGGDLVARVDLKSDRRADALLVRHAHLEPPAPGAGRAWPGPEAVATALGAELRVVADWLGLSAVVAEPTSGVLGPAAAAAAA